MVSERSARLDQITVAILAGGLGTRLSPVLPDAPKVLAPVAGRVFLDFLLESLIGQGARRVVLCLGSRAQAVLDYLARNAFPALEIKAVVEPRPLGTAGAIGHAFRELMSDPVMVMNGDTLVDADLKVFLAAHLQAGAPASVLCARVSDPRRYGRVEIDSAGRVVRFDEKSEAPAAPAWVNAGVYLFDRPLLEEIAKTGAGSLERDVLAPLPAGSIHAHRADAGFLDIGTPESLREASELLHAAKLGSA